MSLESYVSGLSRRDWERETDADPVRFAIVGAGWWARDEAIPAVAESDYCETTVVTDVSTENVRKATEGTDIRGVDVDEFRDGAAAGEYDAVYVSTPNATHPEYVTVAAEHGKAVLCEKPMAATVEGARRMVEVAREHDVTLMVAYRMQTEPAVRRVRELVQEGFVGDVVHAHGHMSATLLDIIPDPDQWRLNPELSGGTTTNDIGIYPLNTIRFVLDRDPVAVYASQESVHEAFDGVDEHVAFQVEFPGATTAVCTASHNSYESDHLRFTGTDGEILIEPVFMPWEDREVTVWRGDVETSFDFEQVNQMTEEFDYFANCLQRGVDPHPDGEHGLVDVQTLDALYESAERNTRIAVEE